MIRKHKGLAVAEAILNILDTMELPDDVQERAYVEVFDNCREQGYVISYFVSVLPSIKQNLYVAFTENRNSDSIVVYEYYKKRFPSNLPHEDSWGNKKYFDFDEHYQAAEHIAEILKCHYAGSIEEKQNV